MKTDQENYSREKLMPYIPWRNEGTDLLGSFDSFSYHFDVMRETILGKMAEYEPNKAITHDFLHLRWCWDINSNKNTVLSIT